MHTNPDRELLREAQKTQYGLRSLFFHRRMRESKFQELIGMVSQLDPASYDWSDLEALGISKSAWNYVNGKRFPVCQIFCHSEVIQANPRLIAYYRGVAGLPLKGIAKLAFGTAGLEAGKGRLSPERARRLAASLNEVISAIVDSDPTYSVADATLLLHATIGATIDGSWRNRVGEEATRQVKELITRYFLAEGLMAQAIGLQGEGIKPDPQLPIGEITGFVTNNDYKVTFGSEPDVEVQGPDGELIGVIEVKGGIDPAGALERYGAAKKTFDKALNRNPRAFTMYLASCITPTVRERIDANRTIRKVFNLTEVLFDEDKRLRFLQEIRWWMRL